MSSHLNYKSILEEGSAKGLFWELRERHDGKREIYFCFKKENKYKNSFYLTEESFNPFEKDEIPSFDVIVRKISNSDFQEWIRENFPPPEKCKIIYNYDEYSNRLSISAFTWKNNRVQKVGKSLKTKSNFSSKIEEIYGYFERNCPAPTKEQESVLAISGIGQEIVNSLYGEGIKILTDMIDLSKRYADRSHKAEVPGCLIKSNSIESVTFQKTASQNQILVKAFFKDNHSYIENSTGADIEINIEPSEAFMKSAKGKKVSDVIEIPGSENCKIKQEGKINAEETGMIFRIENKNKHIVIPEGHHEEESKIRYDIDQLYGQNGEIHKAEYLAIRIIDSLSIHEKRRALIELTTKGHHTTPKDSEYPSCTLSFDDYVMKVTSSNYIEMKAE